MTASQYSLDEHFMAEALAQAGHAAAQGEVPVGAVVVLSGEIIGRGFNSPISRQDPSAHAEVLAIRDAANTVANYRLPEATLYVTIEPCTMCAGLIMHSRIARLVFGATEPKAGVVQSRLSLLAEPYWNHSIEWVGGVLEAQARETMQQFFKDRRAVQKQIKQAARDS